ncbi:hypothetical protein [Helicobacter sp.]|nr:hypothetical protein [Helicobacter sp.]
MNIILDIFLWNLQSFCIEFVESLLCHCVSFYGIAIKFENYN